ncbi:MAG: hypothetical protein WC184_07565 [Acidimicrobiia bacterium]
MKDQTASCLQQHLLDKLKAPNVVPASAWVASAHRHHQSAALIINHDPAGALQMIWSAMHDLAKACSASLGQRLEGETHGKVADFLTCIFADLLSDKELGLIRLLHSRRNASSYDDPRVAQGPLIGSAVNLGAKMVDIVNDWPEFSSD